MRLAGEGLKELTAFGGGGKPRETLLVVPFPRRSLGPETAQGASALAGHDRESGGRRGEQPGDILHARPFRRMA